ncbi:SGNH/GDSL hydrolase family protein [Paenibacillus sp. TAF58]
MSTLAFVHHRAGVPRINEKLLGNDPVTVAFLGGSITEGYGASDPDYTCWRALTGSYLNKRFSNNNMTFVNAGVGGTNSSYGAHRLTEHVLSKGKIDLLFVEFSVNDGDDRDESIRGMEGIVRKCRRLSPQTDICFIYTAADKNLSEELPCNIAVHEEVASYYGIPSVNFAANIYELICSGQHQWEDLAPDRVHPNDVGYAIYASQLCNYLETALHPCLAETSIDQLPPPLNHQNYEYAEQMDIQETSLLEGFVRTEKVPEPLINWRYTTEHWYAYQPKESFTFTICGQGAGLLHFCGPDTGIFEYSLDGEAFQEANPFDEWCLTVTRPVITLFPFQEERKQIQLTIRNTGLKDERSTGTALRVVKLLYN